MKVFVVALIELDNPSFQKEGLRVFKFCSGKNYIRKVFKNPTRMTRSNRSGHLHSSHEPSHDSGHNKNLYSNFINGNPQGYHSVDI